jgi:hypothetical protein
VPEIQAIADYVGDSFELAVRARDTARNLVVFCGVRFMAEGCYTLAPGGAGLPAQPGGARARWPRSTPTTWPSGRSSCARWAGSFSTDDLRQHLRRREGAVDACCTSSNAPKIAGQAGPARHPLRPRPEPGLPGGHQDQPHVPAAARPAPVPPPGVLGAGRAAHPRGRAPGPAGQRLRLGGGLPRPPPDDRRRTSPASGPRIPRRW